jgi:hypothetical protein
MLLSSVGAENSVPSTLTGLGFLNGSPLVAFHHRFAGSYFGSGQSTFIYTSFGSV